MSAGEPAKKNTIYTFDVALRSATDSVSLQSNPTLAAGDVKVSTDNGAFANLGTLPAVNPASGIQVKVTLSAAEMNGDDIGIAFVDQTSPKEWADLFVFIKTSTRQIDDLAYPTTSGRSIDVTAGGTVGIDWANVEAPTTAVNLSATNIDVDQVVASVSGAVGSVGAGGIASTSFAAGAIDAAAIAANAIGASEIAADAVTEIQAGLSTLTAAQVNAEVVDALNVDTYAEPAQGAPAATATLVTKIGFLYKAWRNRHTQTATQYSLYNDDALTIDHKATVSDDATTFDRTEIATGP